MYRMESIQLKSTIVLLNTVQYTFEVSDNLKKYFSSNKLSISYEEDISSVPDEVLNIPFVSIMLPVSWLTNAIIWVEKLDDTFYNSIFNIRRAYQAFYPKFQFGGTVVPAYVIRHELMRQDHSIVLFSGGLDSVTTYINNKHTNPIFLNIYGWIDSDTISNDSYEQDKANLCAFAKREDTPISFITSNFGTLVSSVFNELVKKKLNNTLWYGFQHSMMFISIAIPYAFLHHIDTIYIASSNTMGFRVACASDPTTDIEFKYLNNGRVIHDGFELNRQDKIKCVVNYQKRLGRPFPLQVCSFNDHNCCSCEKCFRTILGLVAENVHLEDFGFYIEGNLKDHFVHVLKEKEQFLGFDFEEQCYWGDIKKRMDENYGVLREKEFVDWFLNYDFKKGKRRAVAEYRRKNFFPLVKRKILKK